jgi:hypothetical protein
MIHVAILKPGYIHDVLAGRKTVESRLTKTAQPPFGKVATGERLFLKASGGSYMATALAGAVSSFRDMRPSDVETLRKRHNRQIGGDDAYWQAKHDSRFATLIELSDVEPIAVGPAYKVAYMRAWYVLDDSLSPVRDWTITAGALRNRYACLPLPRESVRKAGSRVVLELPNREVIETELVRGRMLRWRGWAGLYESGDARPGDTLRFIASGPGRYQVRVVNA